MHPRPAARDPLPASESVPLPVQPRVPSLRKAPGLSCGRNHAHQGEEETQCGRIACQHAGA